MHIEAFTRGKHPGRQHLNEDGFVVMPGRLLAVIDGVSDRDGTLYDGMLSGRFATRSVTRALTRIVAGSHGDLPDAEALADALNVAIRIDAAAAGHPDIASAQWSARPCCTLTAAVFTDEWIEIVAIGDSGARLNGDEIVQVQKPLDDITALLRKAAWDEFAGAGHAPPQCDALAAVVTFQGVRRAQSIEPDIAPEQARTIADHTLSLAIARFPDLDRSEITALIAGGIANAQGRFCNRPDLALGYGCLDGIASPPQLIETRRYPRSAIASIELFTDGYFKPGEAFGIAAWEAAFAEVERLDPHKIGPYPSTKGSTAASATDDRTYLGWQA
jgi:hypothetical protein